MNDDEYPYCDKCDTPKPVLIKVFCAKYDIKYLCLQCLKEIAQ